MKRYLSKNKVSDVDERLLHYLVPFLIQSTTTTTTTRLRFEPRTSTAARVARGERDDDWRDYATYAAPRAPARFEPTYACSSDRLPLWLMAHLINRIAWFSGFVRSIGPNCDVRRQAIGRGERANARRRRRSRHQLRRNGTIFWCWHSECRFVIVCCF